jgi:sec-independent protein translocase protein TatB
MFDIGWSELLVIAVVAIVVIGPKDLPRALRVLGQWTGHIKRMARDFQNQFNEAIREAELDSVQRDIEQIGKMDPVADIRAAAAKAGQDITRDLEKTTEGAKLEREPYPWEVTAPPEPVPVAPPLVPPTEAVAPAAPTATAPEPAPVERKP